MGVVEDEKMMDENNMMVIGLAAPGAGGIGRNEVCFEVEAAEEN